MNTEKLYKIGEVINKLSWEYQDKITAGAIRFWENEGLLQPAQKTEGGHRLYTEEGINWVRFLKELSIAGLSIEEMRERVQLVRSDLEGFKEGSRARMETLFYFTQVIEMQRRRNILDGELGLFFRLDKKQRAEKVYDTEALLRIIATKDAREMIKKAEEYGLVMPKIIDGIKRFSPYEEMIVRILSFMELLRPGAVERCKNLVSTVKYLTMEVEILETFPANRDRDDMTGYNATLYNLVLMNLGSLGLIE